MVKRRICHGRSKNGKVDQSFDLLETMERRLADLETRLTAPAVSNGSPPAD